MTNMKGRSFLKLLDYTPAEIGELLELAADLKAKKKAGVPHRLCEGKSIALVFEKTSNLETDIIGKYVEKLLRPAGDAPKSGGLTLEFLAQNGF